MRFDFWIEHRNHHRIRDYDFRMLTSVIRLPTRLILHLLILSSARNLASVHPEVSVEQFFDLLLLRGVSPSR